MLNHIKQPNSELSDLKWKLGQVIHVCLIFLGNVTGVYISSSNWDWLGWSRIGFHLGLKLSA